MIPFEATLAQCIAVLARYDPNYARDDSANKNEVGNSDNLGRTKALMTSLTTMGTIEMTTVPARSLAVLLLGLFTLQRQLNSYPGLSFSLNLGPFFSQGLRKEKKLSGLRVLLHFQSFCIC